MGVIDIATDDLWPRTLAYRYRLYVRAGDDLEVIGATATPGGIGVAIVDLHMDEKRVGATLSERGRFGVLDTCPDGEEGSEHGEWIVCPFDRGNHT